MQLYKIIIITIVVVNLGILMHDHFDSDYSETACKIYFSTLGCLALAMNLKLWKKGSDE